MRLSASCRIFTAERRLGAGNILNISRGGVLLEVVALSRESLPAIGQVLSIVLDLPVNRQFGPKLLKCTGPVVRRTVTEALVVTLAIQFTKLRTVPKPPADCSDADARCEKCRRRAAVVEFAAR
jgi:hypothetical protein